MGKLLKAFIKDILPDDIMSYADLEWSEGKVYEHLGFTFEEIKDPVTFIIDDEYRRSPLRQAMTGKRIFRNLGSRKYRLKLTEYE